MESIKYILGSRIRSIISKYQKNESHGITRELTISNHHGNELDQLDMTLVDLMVEHFLQSTIRTPFKRSGQKTWQARISIEKYTM